MENKITGLSHKQVLIKESLGLINTEQKSITKSTKQIIKDNVFTLFNLLNFIIAMCLAFVGAWSNLLFFLIIVLNVCIGIFQELHAKKLVDDLSILIVPEVTVIRDSVHQKISVNRLVEDDVVILTAGEQIACDSKIIEGELEVNESMLTGESLPIIKKKDDTLYSGSNVISGKCCAKVIHVGQDNYASKIVSEAQKWKGVKSNLLDSIKKVTKVTCFMILPLGLILFLQSFVLRKSALDVSVITSVAGLLGMLPKGLVLLISMSLAAGIIRLSKKRILVQQLYSLETLAHINTLCLDKTGTLTTGKMSVENEYRYFDEKQETAYQYIRSFLYHSDDNNETYQALVDYFGKEHNFIPIRKIPFSSQRKWSAIEFENKTIVIGAPEKLMNDIPKNIMDEIKDGKRVLVIGQTTQKIDKDHNLPKIYPLFSVILNDVLRKNVTDVLNKLYKEDINIKIISGDHVNAVSAIAKKAGVKNYDDYIDLSIIDDSSIDYEELVQRYTVFGRVTPLQKRKIVSTLQGLGHSVGMTGDGVNDILGLKEADCSIAIAEGSDAVKQISQIVLLDSEFTSLPDVLFEGRRVVNNMTRVAGVFFIKTIYSIFVSIICMLFNMPFPFIPIQITLIDALIEGYPAFLTMLEPDYHPAKKNFLSTALAKAFPKATAITSSIVILSILGNTQVLQASHVQTMMYVCVVIISMIAVIQSCLPMTKLRYFVCFSMVTLFILAIIIFQPLFHIVSIGISEYLIAFIVILVSIFISKMIVYFIKKITVKGEPLWK